ncbi:heme o synthase [Agaribacterium haliotis]|uniref:heme o synthase n=1 Tax=Agaribacterium haliotis TaxID=2013869 RepID=UPI000BB54BE8|nr:heme o synthase [Agaribacterium haliotis]
MNDILSQQRLADYLELCKPRVLALMLLTSAIGMLLASDGWVALNALIFGNLGIALLAASAAAINHLVDKRVDQHMGRTFSRPIAQGRIQDQHAAAFAAVLAALGFTLLYTLVNALCAWLTLTASIGYAVVYSLFLKRATPQNIVIGGLAGAAPPLLGWTAVSNSVEPQALLLVLIICAWTPPHFWALAIHRKEEYAHAKIPMLPVTHGERYTKLQVLLYTLILIICSLLPYLCQMQGLLYLVTASILGFIYLVVVIRMCASHKRQHSLDAFWYSIIYLGLLFVFMLVDHYLRLLN